MLEFFKRFSFSRRVQECDEYLMSKLIEGLRERIKIMAHHGSNPFGDEAPDFIKDMFPEVAKEDFPGFGATHRFPQGKYTPQDEGEIAFGVAADKKAGKVIVNFGKPTAWIGMDRQQALDLAELLKKKADDLLTIETS